MHVLTAQKWQLF